MASTFLFRDDLDDWEAGARDGSDSEDMNSHIATPDANAEHAFCCFAEGVEQLQMHRQMVSHRHWPAMVLVRWRSLPLTLAAGTVPIIVILERLRCKLWFAPPSPVRP